MSGQNKILDAMLERLYASLASGPALSCRPHSSRQRVDLAALAALDGIPNAAPHASPIAALFEEGKFALQATATPPAGKSELLMLEGDEGRPAGRWETQQALLKKLRGIAEDARTYEQDTGASALFVGFPLVSLPPQGGLGRTARRVLAPIALIPVTLAVKATRPFTVTVQCAAEGPDRVIANPTLFAWLEQSRGKGLVARSGEAESESAWEEVGALVRLIEEALGMPVGATAVGPGGTVTPTPTADADELSQPRILPAAVLGLFPARNQGLLLDLEALSEGAAVEGPIESFLRVGRGLGVTKPVPRDARAERLVVTADPCQARAVRLAGRSRGLVVFGPPGTGKSQTIANVIGDHLVRGERVLLVCEKRTALDVVHGRLEHIGLGDLCAVVHDPQRDPRELYRQVREQLDQLADTTLRPEVLERLTAVDAELGRLHDELTGYHAALHGGTPSFHELVGEWLAIGLPPAVGALPAARVVAGVGRDGLLAIERDAREVLARAKTEDAAHNPWMQAAGIGLEAYLARPPEHWKGELTALGGLSGRADATQDPRVPAFEGAAGLADQVTARGELAGLLDKAATQDPGQRTRWVQAPAEEREGALATLDGLQPQIERLGGRKGDPEVALVVGAQPPGIADIVQWLAKLALYRAVARKWFGWLFVFRRLAAGRVLAKLGLGPGADSADRGTAYLEGEKARLLVTEALRRLGREVGTATDAAVAREAEALRGTLQALQVAERDPRLTGVLPRVKEALADPARLPELAGGLRASPERVAAIGALLGRTGETGLFAPVWTKELEARLRRGERVQASVQELEARAGSIEGLLRMQRLLERLPAPVGAALRSLYAVGASSEDGWKAIRRGVLRAEVEARLASVPALGDVDSDRIRASYERVRALEGERRARVREAVQHRWTELQRERLLAATGSRLNGLGADLRRRLALRGERAMRLRQVIQAGAEIPEGDPLFDLRPVWMASPETVAQLFPRRPLFDVVVFDEASQCRLEEALPVLMRGKRVVIAGDPKQLPPTRFFESTTARSQEEAAENTEQGLFEEQQADTEDLLGAALNLEIEQCYLDVHYRSANADLIAFSNEHFYESRLQALPAHPSRTTHVPPLRLVAVGGVYEKRVNPAEATRVVQIVRELLEGPSPPSIGIACFNIAQRDAIVLALESEAARDTAFGHHLATARNRVGAGSFEGLFVKNLENVQGDERDHMIISTTYGPDPAGRFYRRFGPLAQPGGGRRLNVLVTRARQMVHLVTSIPRQVYTALPPVGAGQTPNGAWLLMAYLQYAERLAEEYAQPDTAAGAAIESASRPTGTPSRAVEAVGATLEEQHDVASVRYWGNDGFCVDAALRHPKDPDGVTLGVLVDGTRYPKADDPVEWDLFRTGILEASGWTFHRVWSPALARDPKAAIKAVQKAHEAFLTTKGSPGATVAPS